MSVRKNIPTAEDGGDELGLNRNGDAFEGGQGPETAVARSDGWKQLTAS